MKCGYLSYKEYAKPYTTRYDCQYFGFSSSTEKCLCSGCHLDNGGTPHSETHKKWNCPKDTNKCYWHRKGKPCEDCEDNKCE